MDFLKAMLLILVAEMGDKTQIVAMAFATKYKLHQILIGVALGSAANHGLAIIFGSLLAKSLDMRLVHSASGLLFLVFAYLSLDYEEPEEEEESKEKFGPLITVAIAFFLGELGDKTQLTALSLSTDSVYPFLTLLGTVSGMVITSLLGILIAKRFGERIPEEIMKVLAASAFLVFGIQKVVLAASLIGFGTGPVLSVVLIIAGVMAFRFKKYHTEVQAVRETQLQRRAAALYRMIHAVKLGLEEMCRGEKHCGKCKGKGCLIGYMKIIINLMKEDKPIPADMIRAVNTLIHRDVNRETLKVTLESLLDYYKGHPEEYKKNLALRQVRLALEALMFNEDEPNCSSYEAYAAWIESQRDTL